MRASNFTALTAPGEYTNLPKPRAILFDWDNSLVETWPSIIAALNATLAEMGHPIWSESEAKLKIRASLRDAFPAMFGTRWEIARDIYYREFTRTHLESLVAKPNADELLRYLSQNNGAKTARDPLFLGVVSNKQGKYLRAECTALNWDGYFQALVGANDAVRDKPDPAVIDHVLHGSAILPGPDVWLVGDTAMDMHCAWAAGCTPILVGTPNDGEDFSQYPPAWHCVDLESLLQGCRAMSK
ncbi:MAG: HAD family hydrolase [Alphaproteobacteria bacterium]|nr:HAD family hydrolase [Alphaproteobacteria bacterium]